jgi:glycine zipper 2TM protein
MLDLTRIARLALMPAALLLAVGCRDRAPVPAADSSLAQDLALAQRAGGGPVVFNDAPIGANAPSAPAPAAPARRSEPPTVRAPSPKPTPRRESPPAPVERTPRAPAPTTTQPAPVPAPAPASANGIIGAGAQVGMTTNAKVCAASALAGDKYTAVVTEPTVGSNGAVIPAGATVVIEVASVEHADPVESSRIQFRVRSLDVNGEPRAVDGTVATLGPLEKVQTASGNDRTKVIGGAVAGAVLGRIFGGSTKSTVIGAAAGAAAGTAAAHVTRSTDACLPAGSALRLTLSREIVVPHSAL